MNTYNIGQLTAQHVFKAANLTNMSDMQAVMDAVEVALARYSDAMGEAYQMAGDITYCWSDGFPYDYKRANALLDKLSES